MAQSEEELADLKTELAAYAETLEGRASALDSSQGVSDFSMAAKRQAYRKVAKELKEILRAFNNSK
tara:strand:+ start:1222 stop:1419 length:198 start_codon:yes stop_codon:yes gene_type:complete